MVTIDTCPLCGQTHLQKKFLAVDFLVSQKEFFVEECRSCGLLLTNPRPSDEELEKYYQSNDYISHSDKPIGVFQKLYFFAKNIMLKYKVSLVRQQYKSLYKRKVENILDYGCGTGSFLAVALKISIKPFGFEPDKIAASLAKNKGIEMFETNYSLCSSSVNQKFDAITLWHVLEHIPDFVKKTDMLKTLLNAHGILVVAVPEYKSYDARYYGKNWAAWDVPRHLFHFSKKSLDTLCEEQNLEIRFVKPLVFDSFYIALLSEKNLKSGVLGNLRGLFIGFLSNLFAFLGFFPYSSQIYTLKVKKSR